MLEEKQQAAAQSYSRQPIVTAKTSAEENAAVRDAISETEKRKQSEIEALEHDVAELKRLANPTDAAASDIERIQREIEDLKRDFYANLASWQRVLLARHPQRPYTEDYIRLLFDNFSEIHGDRNFSDDPALITGMAWFHGQPVMVIGSQKGRDTKQRVARNFGQAKPEGY